MEFLQQPSANTNTVSDNKNGYYRVVLRQLLRTDSIPIEYSQFRLFIPSILHKLGVRLIIKRLCSTMLANIDVSNHALITTALTTPVSEAGNNYKLRFLRNSILKFLVSIFIAFKYR
ncbi:hypothetical protein GQ53DRAFT_83337 [Thozetella sp. PMI_491]|nr:hypothetical protein GQ53DRAFT_83337 [Thozetella sp. PMI_491]